MSQKYTKDALEDKAVEHTFKKPSFMTENRAILKKLVCVFLLAGLFMIIEIVGGIIAGSIAILSDAAHMLSDLLGFVISIISVWISGFPANKKHSYGFHRAGVIGALGSVMVIWMLTAFLIYFAVMRVINIDQIQVEGKLMFYVACFGLVTNLIMVKVLHGDHGGHGHHHCHSHGHSHEHKGHTHDHHHEHHHSHKEHEHKHDHDHKHEHEKGHCHHENSEHDHAHKTKHHNHEKKIDKHDMHREDGQREVKIVEKEMVLIPIHNHEKDTISNENLKENPNLSEASAKNNLNVRATIIHILGDILQSIGVIIASALIWAFPHTMKLADPLITFAFAIIILFTTIRVARDCILMLMEATPGGFDVDEFEKNMKRLDGVVELHDLHVWSLGEGKPAMSVHIHTDDEILEVLSKATDMCRSHGIYHSTIQVEGSKDKGSRNYINCEHNIH